MPGTDVQWLRADLETLHQAAGLGLPFDQTDAWLALAMAPAGMFLAAWASFGPAHWLAGGLAPLLGLAAVAVARHGWRACCGAATGARREQAFDRWAVGAVAAGLAVYFLWA